MALAHAAFAVMNPSAGAGAEHEMCRRGLAPRRAGETLTARAVTAGSECTFDVHANAAAAKTTSSAARAHFAQRESGGRGVAGWPLGCVAPIARAVESFLGISAFETHAISFWKAT